MLKRSEVWALYAECEHSDGTPKNQTRNARENVSLAFIAEIKKRTSAKIPRIGRGVVFMHNDNLGTKRYVDIRRVVHISVIEKITEKCVFTSDGCRIGPDDIICVFNERG